jgi:hypothetical protein
MYRRLGKEKDCENETQQQSRAKEMVSENECKWDQNTGRKKK